MERVKIIPMNGSLFKSKINQNFNFRMKYNREKFSFSKKNNSVATK